MNSNRREDILQQAMALIIEDGLGELTMSKVAHRMGFTEPAMYRHFRNKQDLILNLVHRIATGFEEIFTRLNQDEPPEVFFPRYFKALLEYLESVRGVTFLFLSESTISRDPAVREELQEMFLQQNRRIAGYLENAAKRREILPTVDPAAAALVFLGTVQAITTSFLLGPRGAGIPRSSRSALDIFLKGLIG